MSSRRVVTAGALALGCLLAAQVAAPQTRPANEDPILRAMRDELDRSRQLRAAGGGDVPYFIQYELTDAENFNASATLGALVGSIATHFRAPSVEVRVGSYDFDSTDHIFSGYHIGPRYDPEQWPLDDNYNLLRQCFWLATDREYKAALESIGRKRASLKNTSNVELTPDFSRTQPVVSVLKVIRPNLDMAVWTNRVVKLSALFAAYPDVLSSGVDFQAAQGTTYLVNSEGAMIRYPDSIYILRGKAEGMAPDGMSVRDVVVFQALDPGKLPGEAEMRRATLEAAENVKALAHAPLAESYTGPVLFEPAAAAQLLAQLLGENLRVPRKPLADPGRSVPFLASEFESRIGSRVMPEFIDVVDDPTETEWKGKPLAGHYLFDLEGVAPKPVTVIEKGVLKGFLMTRQPIKGFSGSNGHARLPGNYGARSAAIGNLFIRASQTAPMADLKRKLIELATQRNKPYGLLVRKLDYPFSGSVAEIRRLATAMAQTGSASRLVGPPLLVYRVYPDGREELVRGLRFRDLTTRSLRDIVAASAETELFDFTNNAAPMALMGAGGYLAGTSVISPGLLFEELELERSQDTLPKPPLVPPPPLTLESGGK